MQNCIRITMAIVTIASVLAGTGGCGKSNTPDYKPVVPVRGKVLVSGKPAAGAVVCFHPIADPGPRALRSHGRVGDDGVFSLTTYATTDGAPQGEYVVTVYWAAPSRTPRDEDDTSDLPPDLLRGRFAARETSILRTIVGDKPVEFAPVDLGSAEVTKAREYFLREE
jgi:hypothetical protein